LMGSASREAVDRQARLAGNGASFSRTATPYWIIPVALIPSISP